MRLLLGLALGVTKGEVEGNSYWFVIGLEKGEAKYEALKSTLWLTEGRALWHLHGLELELGLGLGLAKGEVEDNKLGLGLLVD